MKNFRTLELAIDFYKEIEGVKAKYFLKDQLLRAASSIALNLGEGAGKRTRKDMKKFYQIAFGSIRECQEQG